MPYRTPPQKKLSWSWRVWTVSILTWFKNLFKPKCKLEGGACEFKCVEEVEASWDNKNHHDIVYYDRPISGSPNGGFYWGMLIPHRLACKFCKRAFRIGDPLPKGARLDHWVWARGIRKRPEYISESDWAVLESSGYFERSH
jgi:uncharacterized protein YbaR (Trm112 family)